MRLTRYAFTLNNYTPREVDHISNLVNDDRVSYVIFGREVGENGTPHLQGFIKLVSSMRLVAVKTLVSSRAHFEQCRGTSAHNITYCKKDGDFVEFGTPPSEDQGKRNDIVAIKAWILELGHPPSAHEWYNSEFAMHYMKWGRKLGEMAKAILPSPPVEHGEPRDGWQTDLFDYLDSPPSPRSVKFIVDHNGDSGKSWFARWFLNKYPEKTQYMRPGKRDDMAFAIDDSKTVFLFDVPRSQMETFNYSILEQLKDKMVFSAKYESTLKQFRNNVHVVVMCNETPNMNALSRDRYDIVDVGMPILN